MRISLLLASIVYAFPQISPAIVEIDETSLQYLSKWDFTGNLTIDMNRCMHWWRDIGIENRIDILLGLFEIKHAALNVKIETYEQTDESEPTDEEMAAFTEGQLDMREYYNLALDCSEIGASPKFPGGYREIFKLIFKGLEWQFAFWKNGGVRAREEAKRPTGAGGGGASKVEAMRDAEMGEAVVGTHTLPLYLVRSKSSRASITDLQSMKLE
jgi:hypothetical protein